MKLRSDVAGFLAGTRGAERVGRKEMKPTPGHVSTSQDFSLSQILYFQDSHLVVAFPL